MDPRFMVDPVTGQAGVPMPGGGALPTGMSPDAMRAALGGVAPVTPGGYDPSTGTFAQAAPPPMTPDQLRQQLMPRPPAPAPPPPGSHAGSRPGGLPVSPDAWRQDAHGGELGGMAPDPRFNAPASYVVDASEGGEGAAPAGVDPSKLVRAGAGGAGGAGGSAGPGGETREQMLIRLAGEEAARAGRGGGGKPGLAEVGETRKIHELGAVPESVARAAGESREASSSYDQALAAQLRDQQDSGYQAYMGEQAARAGALQAQQQQYEHQQAELQKYQAKRDALANEAAQMKAPQMEDYWGSRSTSAKMATALAITVGGALAGLRGGPNMGLEASNQEIERWIAGQKEAYARKRGAVDDADNQYAKMVKTFENSNLAEQHLRLQAYEIRDNMLKSYAEKVGTPNAMEAYQQAALQSQAQKDAAAAKAYQDAGAEIEQKFTMRGGGTGAGGSPTVLKILRAQAEAKKLNDEINGVKSGGGNPAEVATLNEAEAGMVPLKNMLKGYQGQETIPGVGGRNVARRAGRAIQDFVGGEGSAASSDTQEEQTNRQIVDRARLAYKHLVTGSGGSDAEAAQIDEAFAGAKNAVGLNNAVRIAEQTIAEHRRLLKGGESAAAPSGGAAPSFQAER